MGRCKSFAIDLGAAVLFAAPVVSGIAGDSPWSFWNGRTHRLWSQALAHGGPRFDRYVEATLRGDPAAQQVLAAREVEGLRTFIGKGQCVSCDNGPLFTDHHFHNAAVPPRDLRQPDLGRAAAIARLQADEFNCLGAFSDAKPTQYEELRFMVTETRALEGAFKTPDLRGVAQRAPYMHAGQFATLDEVVAHYMKAPPAAIEHSELAHGGTGHAAREPLRLSAQQVSDLVAFLATLSGPITEDPGRQAWGSKGN